MPFGLNNALWAFMDLMNLVFQMSLNVFMIGLIDNILIIHNRRSHSTSKVGPIDTQRMLLSFPSVTFDWMKLQPWSCHLYGRHVRGSFEGMIKWEQPKTVVSIKNFLGLAYYYRISIKDFPIIALPMT